MAICDQCGSDMLIADGCEWAPYPYETGPTDPIPWEGPGRCPDCNAIPDHYHHPGCDIERCPKCGGQAISCTCWLASEPEEGQAQP